VRFPSNWKSRSCLALSLTAAVAVGACGRPASDTVAAAADTTGISSTPIDVLTSAAVERELPVVVQATGSFAPDEVSDVAPETSGVVAATPVNVGDRVSRGAVIARLSTADPELRLQQARAGLLQAQAALAQATERHTLASANARRYDALAKTGDVSQTLHEQAASEGVTTQQGVATADAAVADARSRVALAEKALADTVIRAPFDGFITDRPVAVGEYVTTSSRMATVMKLNPIRLRLQVPELQAARLLVGQGVKVTVDALAGPALEGRITAINPSLDAATRATIVEASLPNAGGAIRAGMFATAQIALSDHERAVFVPRGALLADPNTNSFRVFVVEDNVARLRVVQPGPEQGDAVRIVSGVAAGATVATNRLDQLFDGAAVNAGRSH
jgi:RND family efflux transporter MFP subunit